MQLKEIELNVKRLKDGDIAGLEYLYQQTKRSVFLTAFSVLKNYDLSEDIMQETYIIVVNKIYQYKENTNFTAWVATIARNLALKEIERQKLTLPIENREFAVDDSKILAFADNTALKTAFKVLKNREREIVVLHAVNGLKHKEIAKILNMPLGSVLWSYNNAIKKLKKTMEEKGSEKSKA